MMDPLTLCPVGMDVQEGDAGTCVSQSTMPTASPQQPICCSEEPSHVLAEWWPAGRD